MSSVVAIREISMIFIHKGKEPRELTKFKSQPFSNYNNIPSDIKSAILEKLIEEQRELCAYCTCHIPEEDAKRRGQHPVTIEHLYPQSPCGEDTRACWDLRYSNMLAVCSGNRGCGANKNFTCDARKGNTIIRLSPFDYHCISQIHYRNNGDIYADEEELNRELNEILNLNCKARSLSANRKKVLDDIKKTLPQDSRFKKSCRRMLEILQENPLPFCGMAIEWLKRKSC